MLRALLKKGPGWCIHPLLGRHFGPLGWYNRTSGRGTNLGPLGGTFVRSPQGGAFVLLFGPMWGHLAGGGNRPPM